MTMRLVLCTLACALGILLPALPAAAQAVPGWNTKQFSLERLDADRVRLVGEVEVEGEPGGPNAGQKFFADELEANTKTGEFTARGNVVFSTATERISGESVTFNTRTRLGAFSNASGIASLAQRGINRSLFGTLEPDVFFYGKAIEKIGPDKYRIRDGGFTTCVQPTPRWEVVTGSATINLHDYAVLKNAVIQVKDVPVFYLPVLYYPIQDDDRATGILIPTYGASTYRGQSISNAFFWAINRSQDATFFHDWFFSRNNSGVGSEYRYVLGPAARGDFRAYWLNEQASVINGVQQPARQSSQITGNLSHGLPLRLTARARVDYFSNLTVQQLYNNSFYSASQSTRTVSAGVAGAWRALSVNANFQRAENFYNVTDSFVSGFAPGITLAYSGQKVPFVPIYATANLDAANVLNIQNTSRGETDLSLYRVDFLPSLRAPLSTLPYLTVNATAGYRTTYFSESLADDRRTQIEKPVTRSYADLRLEVIGPVFSRVFTPGNRFADRLKHVIEPSYSVQRRTPISAQNRVPISAGGYDTVIGGATQVSYGLANRLLARKAAAPAPEGGPAQAGAPLEVLTVSVRQTYYTDPLSSRFDNQYSYGYLNRPANLFSPIALLARGAPAESLAVDFRLEYDPVKGAKIRLPGFGLNGTLRLPSVDATAGWSRNSYATGQATTASANYLQSGANVRLLDGRIGGQVSFNYDIGRAALLNQRYIGFYNAQCCGISFEYQAYNYPAASNIPVPKDRRFNLAFTLAGIGTFSNFLGAFGVGSY
jgi:LPS-assembly protein